MRKAICTLSILFFVSYISIAEPIGQISYEGWSATTGGIFSEGPLNPDEFDMSFAYVEDYVSTPANTISWDTSGNDVGKTFYATTQTHSQFQNLAVLLTDGINQDFSATLWWPEQDWGKSGAGDLFFKESEILKTTSSYPDFIGHTIGTIAITFDKFDLSYPFIDDFGSSGSEVSFGYTVTFYSEIIPEPATLSLLSIGGLALLRKRK